MQGTIVHVFQEPALPGDYCGQCWGHRAHHTPAPNPAAEQLAKNTAQATAIQTGLTAIQRMTDDAPGLSVYVLDRVASLIRDLERERDSFANAAEFLKTSMETP